MKSECLAALAPYQLRRISFVKASKADAVPLPLGVDILVLNTTPEGVDEKDMRKRHGKNEIKSNNAASRKSPQLQVDDLSLRWSTVQKMGPGLVNLGNTCFMNSVLQCLTHTPPLAEALLSGTGRMDGVKAHSTRAYMAQNNRLSGSSGIADSLATTRAHIEKALRHRSSVISPMAHVRSLRSLSTSFKRGRQEDAHEYLIALLDSMHTMAMGGPAAKPSPSVRRTSLIHRIFAGRICSKVTCTSCKFESNTYDPFLDISLEINHASSVKKAFERFTSSESLDGSNMYKCPRENRMVRAKKRMAVEDAPAVLIVQLKRFEFSARSRTKISKRVEFDTWLDLAPFMANRQGPVRYQLFGVLVHHGHTLHAGHYVAFVRGPNGLWHLMDDSCVSQVSERLVLGQKAYMLFYVREEPGSNGSLSVSARTLVARNPRRSSDQQMKPAQMPPAAPSVAPTNDVAKSAHSRLAPIATPAVTASDVQPCSTPTIVADRTKRKTLAGGDTLSPSSPPEKRQRASQLARTGQSSPPAATPKGPLGAQPAAAQTPAVRQYHVRLRKELARALSPTWPKSPSQGRGQRRMERHLLDHRARLSLSAKLSRPATSDSPVAVATSPARSLRPRSAHGAPAVANASVLPAFSPRMLTSPDSTQPDGTAIGTPIAASGARIPDSRRHQPRAAAVKPPMLSNSKGHSSGKACGPGQSARRASSPIAASPQRPSLPSPAVSTPAGTNTVSQEMQEQQQQEQERKSKSRGKVAAVTLTGVDAATALLENSSARTAPSWQHGDHSTLAQGNSGPSATGNDDYNAAYDRGKQKKLRKGSTAIEGISEASFHGAWKASKRQRNR